MIHRSSAVDARATRSGSRCITVALLAVLLVAREAVAQPAVVTGVPVFRSEPPTPGTAELRTVRVAGRDGELVLRFGAPR